MRLQFGWHGALRIRGAAVFWTFCFSEITGVPVKRIEI